MDGPKTKISAHDALGLIVKGHPLNNYHIEGELSLHKLGDQLDYGLCIDHCILDNLFFVGPAFRHPLQLTGSVFRQCSFNYAYFLKGLMIDNCIFESYLDFEAGGHNQNSSLFVIKNSIFHGFVNFFDCWFQGGVIVSGNHFQKGTNLQGNLNKPYRVSFDVAPVVQNNSGPLDLNGEGDRMVNIIEQL